MACAGLLKNVKLKTLSAKNKSYLPINVDMVHPDQDCPFNVSKNQAWTITTISVYFQIFDSLFGVD